MKEATLIILAAGLGSRYGGLKQLDAFLPGEKTIIEYSVENAYMAGFRHFVIVIRKENENEVKKMIQHSFDDDYNIDYVYQENVVHRIKPLGTAQALLCCKGKIKDVAGIINGDDYYGQDAFEKLYYTLMRDVDKTHYAMIGYELENTLSKNGGVSRGICQVKQGNLISVQECTNILQKDGHLTCDQNIELTDKQIVSMNMWAFSKDIFDDLEFCFKQFMATDYKDNPQKAEFYLPNVFDYLIKNKKITLKVVPTSSKWYGVTYQEDKHFVYEGIVATTKNRTIDLKQYDKKMTLVKKIAKLFKINEEPIQILVNNAGNINDSFIVKTKHHRYLLQRINHQIFKNIDGLMNNMALVTHYLQSLHKTTLEIIPTYTGDHYICFDHNYYRMFKYIENSFTYDYNDDADKFYETGCCFGEFFNDLHGFDAQNLVESIPDFHNTPKRYEQFEESLLTASNERLAMAKQEITEIKNRRYISSLLYQRFEKGEIKLRVCHNDTKLSNILMDKTTKKPICVIDFDTIMPGFIGYDYGDALRSGANHTFEDDECLEHVYFDLDMFKAFTKGFLEKLGSILTKGEIDSLVDSVKVIVYEQAMRFLTDYLNNDIYYKTNYKQHNLVRARNQIALLQDIENKEEQMKAIINDYR